MADFATWTQTALAAFAAESQAEIVRLNNENAAALRALLGLVREYERCGEIYCYVPARHEAYRKAKAVLK